MKENILDDFGKTDDNFEFFRNFFFEAQAEDVVTLLKESNIPFKLEKSSTIIDEAIVGNSLTPKIILRLPPNYFKKANAIIKENIVLEADFVTGHYLNQLEDKELIEIFEKPDEWAIEDALVAQQILGNRGLEFSDADIKKLQEERLGKLRAGKRETFGRMAGYYILIMGVSFFLSVLFIFAGLGLAWYYWKDTSVDSTGHKYFTYDSGTRELGKTAFWFWLILIIPFYFFALPIIMVDVMLF